MRLLLLLLLTLGLQAQTLQYSPPEDPDEVLVLPPEAKAFFANYIDQNSSIEDKVDVILEVILAKDKFGFVYEGTGFYSVAETFKRRKGNCQSFAMLLTSLCRAFEIPANFNHVKSYTPKWNRIENIIVEVDHVNVRVEDDTRSFILDLAPFVERSLFVYESRPITDAEMLSMFYSNSGVILYAKGQRQEALHWMQKAIEIETAPSSIRNIAVAYLGLSQYPEAELYARQAYSIERSDPRCASLMASVMRKQGKEDEGAYYEKKAKRYEQQNPYYHFFEARAAQGNNDLPGAMKFINKAISLKSDEVQFWQLKKELLVLDNKSTSSVDRKIQRLQQR